MKTIVKTIRFMLIVCVASAISFGTMATATYAKDQKVGASKAGSHQASNHKKGKKAGKASSQKKGDTTGKASNQKKGDKASKAYADSSGGQKSKAKKARFAVGAISAGTDPVSPASKGKRPTRTAAFISRFDQDGDSEVTLAEIEAASQTKFNSLDTNADGNISNAELNTANAIAVGDLVTKVIAKQDNDGDGIITTSEAYQLVGRVVAGGGDTDSDGVISSAELTAHYTTLQTNAQLGELDTDTDGNISSAEYDITAATKFTKLDTDGDGVVGD